MKFKLTESHEQLKETVSLQDRAAHAARGICELIEKSKYSARSVTCHNDTVTIETVDGATKTFSVAAKNCIVYSLSDEFDTWMETSDLQKFIQDSSVIVLDSKN